MPVGGYEQKRVWQYRFRPLPAPVLDRDWDARDREWKVGVVERLRRGEAAPRSLSVYEILPSTPSGEAGGWEVAEARSKDAIRTGAVFLNDTAIARRLPERELRKQAWAEAQAEWNARWEVQSAYRAEKDAALAEARKAWRAQEAERARVEAERAAEWERAAAWRQQVLAEARKAAQEAEAALAAKAPELQAAYERALFLLEKRLSP